MKLSIAVLLMCLLAACSENRSGPQDGGHGHGATDEFERGPHNGRLLADEDVALELAIFETGVPPEYRIWLYEEGEPLAPSAARVQVKLTRLDGESDVFPFEPENGFLRGNGVVEEPHSFDVEVTATWDNGRRSQWAFASYEGRTQIHSPTAQEMGIATETAGSVTLRERVRLSGVVQADPTRISRVKARYPGVVQRVAVEPTDVVNKGDLLAQVQSNESLQSYRITAPIPGIVVEHRAQAGEATGDGTLFTIVDISKVWAELDVFQRELSRIQEGQPVELMDLDDRYVATGRIERIAPLAMHGSQSVRARVVLDNASGQLRPGQFVSGLVTVAESSVPLAVERQAIQRFRDFDVVFERIGDTYEVRMLELGRSDDTHVEVLKGLEPGAQYVVENSYLIKADIEKSGASHDH
jgi:cobalt-zinc-cadmium efflux system membrane fusion protein